MDFTFTFKGLDSSDAIKQYAEKKFSKFEKYFYGPVSAQIVFKREKFREIVEVILSGDGETIIAKEETSDIYEAIDLAYETLEKQIKKYKEKRKDFRKNKIEVSEPIPEAKYVVETIDVNPMSISEAVELFEKGNDRFMLFYSTDHDKIALVTKRGDKIVVLVPEFS
ncbi:MAG: ribosome-associated translation inhibitor RaiA [Thermodesulfobacteria bacterium]|nr:ribosome-associated translation inhibitor RaiA [Thermodesulfobacteriota bacterium]